MHCIKVMKFMTYRLPDFYRSVLVFLPFSATALGIFTITVMILLEWWHRNRVTQVIIRLQTSLVPGLSPPTTMTKSKERAWYHFTHDATEQTRLMDISIGKFRCHSRVDRCSITLRVISTSLGLLK